MSSPTIGVQSLRRAFAVLRALGNGPLGVSDVASGVPHPEIDGGPPALAPGRRGRRRAGARRAPLPARPGPAGDRVRPERDVGHRVDRAPDARGSCRGARRGGRGLDPRRLDGPVRRQMEPPNPNQVTVRDWTGTRIPLHAVSSGQVFLAQLPGPMLARYLAEPLEAFTPRTLDRRGRAAASGSATFAATGTPGSSTSTRSGSAPSPPRSPTRAPRSSPRCTSTGLPTNSRPPGEEDRIAARVRTAAARIGARLRAGG